MKISDSSPLFGVCILRIGQDYSPVIPGMRRLRVGKGAVCYPIKDDHIRSARGLHPLVEHAAHPKPICPSPHSISGNPRISLRFVRGKLTQSPPSNLTKIQDEPGRDRLVAV